MINKSDKLLRGSLQIVDAAILAIQQNREYTTELEASELTKHWVAIQIAIDRNLKVSKDTVLN